MTGEPSASARALTAVDSVHVIGTGLIGTSLGLALSRLGVDVTLEDASPTSTALARDLGAGRIGASESPSVVIVATPPDVTAAVVDDALRRWPTATVTDVASVKGSIREALQRAGVDLTRYVGSHPMAGRERSGAVSGRVDLFEGRAWVITAGDETRPESLALVRRLAEAVGSAVTVMPPADHDGAVAAVSHVPQVVASLVAARLEHLPDDAVALAGQGLRDVTRIAASDPQLWTQILAGNAAAVADVLESVATDLDAVVGALRALDGEGGGAATVPGARAVLARSIAAGNSGHARIPGKHGAAPAHYATVRVVVDDRPGELARLLADIGDAGVNLEELRLDHGLGQAFGLAEVDVLPASATFLEEELVRRAWRLHG
ncbi:prephenate dehydrogenase [Janibacter sp. G1551]|uniref:prephenate dehydrogenase n=1 Tax=Janibacter sp. G1551 TaxID=3420440 RepID=UPI003CFE5731